ncbi:MAG: YkgJ family cysteine cluster protein [Spirochaetota bacterium]
MKEEYRLIVERAVSKKQQIARLIKRLKKHRPAYVQETLLQAHEQAFERIDCLQCANCCLQVGPLVNEQDVERIAKTLRITRRDVVRQYLRRDQEGDFVFSHLPCPFLMADNRCLIYEQRPKACREYPHTDQRYIHRYLPQTEKNSRFCPAVALMFESLLDGVHGPS